MKVSVLIPYCQGRRALLERTLWLLKRQTYDDYDVWILDDGSTENISELCDGKIIYKQVRGAGGKKRSANIAWNIGYRICGGEFIILSHPEYMVPLDAIERLVEQYDGNHRLVPTAYAIPEEFLPRIDELDWKTDLDLIQTLPDFWNILTPWGWINEVAKSWHHHFVFTGQTRDAWDTHNFIPDTGKWGMNDSWILAPEHRARRYPIGADFAVYHQHHARLFSGGGGKSYKSGVQERSIRVQRIKASIDKLSPGDMIAIRSLWPARTKVKTPGGSVYEGSHSGSRVNVKKEDAGFVMGRNHYANTFDRVYFEIV